MKITIPNPCSEDWQRMTATEKGQFCASCQKCVVDFTTMTDVEIIRYLNQQEGKTCGRFTEEQLNRTLTPPNRLTIPFAKWVLASTFSLGFMMSKEGFATMPVGQTQQSLAFSQKNKKMQSVVNDSFTNYLVIQGVVLDSLSKDAFIGASIVIKGTNRGVVTDMDGNFTLNTFVKYQYETVTLVVSFPGYVTKEVVVHAENGSMKMKIEMIQHVLGGIEYMTARPTLWQRTKRLFRKRYH